MSYCHKQYIFAGWPDGPDWSLLVNLLSSQNATKNTFSDYSLIDLILNAINVNQIFDLQQILKQKNTTCFCPCFANNFIT